MKYPKQVVAVVLAAGKGTRMKSELPKVVTPLLDKSLVRYVLDSLLQLELNKIFVVVGYKKEVVMKELSDYSQIEFVEQRDQLGTGHALLTTQEKLSHFSGSILVCCGDVPFIRPQTFSNLLNHHFLNQNSLTVLSAKVSNPFGYGRLVRNSKGELLEIVEEKDANPEQKKITEINTGTYVLESPSVFSYLLQVGKENAQGEYYLPDLVKIYKKLGHSVDGYLLENPLECTGVNSPDELTYAQSLIQEGKVLV
ncbi:MAG: NTP transferase domain-containing protein [Leptospiraceae bacterium]|nr:NTP transferase domain-containing protein [Leptospiraceae bacterium]